MSAPEVDPLRDHVWHPAVRAVANFRPASAKSTNYMFGRITKISNNSTAITRAATAIVLVFMCVSSDS